MTILFISLTICFVLFVFWAFYKPHSELLVCDLKISKKTFVLLVLQWCAENLGVTKLNYQLKIYYYPNKKFSGRFHFYNSLIVIYVYDELILIELVDTIIHEYVHRLQFAKKADERNYDKKSQELGYWDNPYEVEARKQAKQYRNDCFNWIVANYSI